MFVNLCFIKKENKDQREGISLKEAKRTASLFDN